MTSAPTRSVTLGRSRTGRTAIVSASALACTRQGYPSHHVQRMQVLRFALGLVEHDAARRVERVVPALLQLVGELLDARLVRHRRPRIRRRAVTLGGVLTAVAVDVVERLGLAVPGLEVVVAQGPRRRDPVDVLQLAEVLRPQPVQGGPVELRGAAHVVVDLRLEGLAVGVVPGVLRDVLALDEHRARGPSCPSRAAGSAPARGAGCACPIRPGRRSASHRRRRCR